MAFCTRCGKKLQEGEVCTCQQNIVPSHNISETKQQATPAEQQAAQDMTYTKEEPKQEYTYEQQPTGQNAQPAGQNIQPTATQPKISGEAVTGVLKQALNDFVGLVKKPVTEGKAMIDQANLVVAAVFIALQGILSGIFAMIACHKYSAGISAVGVFIDDYSSLLGRDSDVENALKMPYIRIFFVTLLCSVVFSCLLAALLMLGNMILKKKVSFEAALTAASVRSAVLSPVILASFLLFALNPTFGILIYFGANIWGFTVMVLSLAQEETQESKDVFSYVITGVIALFFLITVFCMLKMWTMYLPDTLRKVFSNPSALMQILK